MLQSIITLQSGVKWKGSSKIQGPHTFTEVVISLSENLWSLFPGVHIFPPGVQISSHIKQV